MKIIFITLALWLGIFFPELGLIYVGLIVLGLLIEIIAKIKLAVNRKLSLEQFNKND